MRAYKLSDSSASREAAGWDRVWSGYAYSRPAVQAERARVKVGAAVELGLRLRASDRVVNLACGSGQILLEVAQRVCREVRMVGVDISMVALSLAAANFKRAGVSAAAVRGEWSKLPLRTASIDCVLAFMSPEPPVMIELERVLGPVGELFVIAPSRRSFTSILFGMREYLRPHLFAERDNYRPGELIDLLAKHFEVKGWRILHCGADRPLVVRLDRIIARFLPHWGRYIVVRCEKSATR